MLPAGPRRTALAVLVFCFAMGLIARGMPDNFGVFVVPLAQDFGWDRAEIVSIYSFYALSSGLMGPLVGRLSSTARARAPSMRWASACSVARSRLPASRNRSGSSR